MDNLLKVLMKKIYYLLIFLIATNLYSQETWEELNTKVNSYYLQGKYEIAVEYCLKALKVAEKEYGKDSKYYAGSENFLGLLYQNLGEYLKAEPLYKSSSEKFKKLFGANHPIYGQALKNLGYLYYLMHQYQLAERNLLEAKVIYENNYGADNKEVAVVMYNLAEVYFESKQYDKAEEYYISAILIYRKAFGQGNLNYITAVYKLATLYKVKKEFKKAEPLYKEIMQIYEKLNGNNSIEYAHALTNYAEIKDYLNHSDIAEQYLNRALVLFENFYGKNNQFYIQTLQKLARVTNNLGEFEKSYGYWKQTLDKYKFQIKYFFPSMNETEKGTFYNTIKPFFEEFVSFVLKWRDKDPQLLVQLYDNILLTKALLLNSTSKVRKQILNSGNQQLIDKFKSWLSLKEKLARFYSLSKERLEKSKINLKLYEKKVDLIERELTKESEAFASGFAKKEIHWEDIKNSLKDNEAVVDIIRFRYFNKHWTDSVLYGYFITTNESDIPKLIINPIGNMLENEYLHCYKNMIRHQLFDYDSYGVYWKLIQENLSNSVHKIYISLDGVYNLINVNTIQYPDGSYVIDSLRVVLINNSRKLLERKFEKSHKATENLAVLFGFPDFEFDKSQELLAMADNLQNDEMLKLEVQSLKPWDSFKMAQASQEIKKFNIIPLPGTKVEIESILSILQKKNWKVKKFIGKEAREKYVKNLKSPKILHIATHGYFLKDVEINPDETIFGVNAEKIYENPLLRSGLLFAGATYEIENDNPSDYITNDNSILTAYEAMNLELDNTDLVVLSACETGLGEVQVGEGVYGLQRAFEVAGAKSILMSLWKVSDITTKELMIKFYKEYLDNTNKYKSFRDAQLYIKNKYRWPYFWGAFVLVGEE